MLTSIYNAFSVDDYLSDQAWAGGRIDAIQLHGGTAGWGDWLSSVKWQADMFAEQDVSIMWSIPLVPYGATLRDAGAGKFDDKFLAMAKQLAASSEGDSQIYVRLGWEFNGKGWNSSSAVGDADGYVAAFRKFVDVARTVSDKFVFEWCPAMDTWDMNPETAYPGDKYVDVIGVDMYYNTAWHDKDGARAFDWMVKQPYGLQWQQDFAAAHGKQTAIGEWGLNSDNPEFVKLAMQWMADHDMAYQNYWESDAAFKGDLSSGQYKEAAAAYLTMLDKVATPDASATITSATDRALVGNERALTLIGAAIRGWGNAHDNVITGNAQNNDLFGGAGKDKLYGGAGDDRLDGGVGADTLVGGTGNDTYFVDDRGDRVVERPGEGIDTVYAKVDYTLGSNVENLVLVGGATKGTGNALNNAISGTDAGDVLSGLDGDDVLKGYGGDDVLLGGNGRDTLYGMDGEDYLDGGAGADTMVGGAGHDTYIVDNSGDRVVEEAGAAGGFDTVYASVNHTMAANVEALYLSGDARIGTGNASDNFIYGTAFGDSLSGMDGNDVIYGYGGDDKLYGGNGDDQLYGGDGNDWLDGYTGVDIMDGGKGNDTYVVDNIGDKVIESYAGAQGGTDLVLSSIDYTLGANVENLTLTGSAIYATGNALDNVLRGNAQDNVLTGGAGNDILWGGAGNDRFVFAKGSGKDQIVDFSRGDSIDVSAWHFHSAPSVSNVRGGTLIDLGGGDTILLQNVTADHVVFHDGSFGFV